MLPFRPLLIAASLVSLGGCAVLEKPKPVVPKPIVQLAEPTKADVWRGIVEPADLERIQRLSVAWAEGLSEARVGRFSAAVRDEGDLLRPEAALARPAPTPGSYNCRLVRLGKTDRRSPALERFKPFFCYVEVEGEILTIVKQTGSERPAGRLWEDDIATRLIFLGSLALGEREKTKAYGEDATRDMAGVLERVGPMRWRLALPYPRSRAKLDVYELTPVAEQPKG